MGEKGPPIAAEREKRVQYYLEDCRRKRNPMPEKVELEKKDGRRWRVRLQKWSKEKRRRVSDSDGESEPSETEARTPLNSSHSYGSDSK